MPLSRGFIWAYWEQFTQRVLERWWNGVLAGLWGKGFSLIPAIQDWRNKYWLRVVSVRDIA